MTDLFTQEELIKLLIKNKGRIGHCAQELKCDIRTVRKEIENDEGMLKLLETIVAIRVDDYEQILDELALEKKNLTAVITFLTNKAKDRGYGNVDGESTQGDIIIKLENADNSGPVTKITIEAPSTAIADAKKLEKIDGMKKA